MSHSPLLNFYLISENARELMLDRCLIYGPVRLPATTSVKLMQA